ncbi:TMEM175 family protein [Micromonospora sp. HUAS LYJ1]|uniref:TMEM175 family protein n=1 Tax=Micromonospora sp. HUAS LYJ1 TaxID=3061626 RepID=UPI002673411C|nr:TMEM175 family protein [Micromonospora sp. HUAS LYJ1]WKU05467.1 TMEM175 family protein [Micromonospora sp. HUAS LYJ1]
MSRPTDDIGTRSDTSRAISFSDAVFAIIITLLVLDLRVPDVPPGRLLSGLLQQWPGYLAYLASYTYVAIVWLNHKAAFNRIKESDRGLHWVNLLVLFTTALLPFPTAAVSEALQEHDQHDQRVAVAFYALIGALLCASWLAFFYYLARREDLLQKEGSERHFSAERVRALVGVILYAAAGFVGYLVAPLAGLVIFVVLPVFYAVTSAGLYQLPLIRRTAHRNPESGS